MTNSGQSLPPELLTRVCEAVDQFDAAWQAVAQGATPPWIEDALRGISAADQPTFLRELLAIEVECRRRFGEQPIEREYKARFPRHAKLVDDVFREVQHAQAPETLAARGFVEEAAVDTLQPPASRNIPRSANLGFQPGDVLHDYVLLEKLGQGGMGAVFKAQHSRLKKIVAIKVLPESRTADPDAVARFQREMEAVGQLRHPHVVEAYDAGDAEGTHYLVIEYVAGMDLATVIRSIGEPRFGEQRDSKSQTGITPSQDSQSHDTLVSMPSASGRSSASDAVAPRDVRKTVRMISCADACEIIRQAALGLQHAHERGLIHRDIKPSNLLLSTEGVVKVLDLGLARLQSEHPAGNLTSTGQVMGTVDYIAPEQITDSHHVDLRADLYSLGCTLYHLLAGHPPFAAPSYSSIYLKMKAHENSAPPNIARTDIPEGVLAVLDKLLRKQPAERFASAGEVATVLVPFTSGCGLIRLLAVAKGDLPVEQVSQPARLETAILSESSSKEAPPRGTLRKTLLAVAGVAAMLLLGVIIIAITNKDATKINVEVTKSEISNSQSEISSQAGWHVWPTDSPPPAIAPFDSVQANNHQEAWAKYLGVPVEYTNSLGMKFRLIPPGEFMMGSTPEEMEQALKLAPIGDAMLLQLVKSELPSHRVILTRPFYLGIHEVTQGQYVALMERNPSTFSETGFQSRPAF